MTGNEFINHFHGNRNIFKFLQENNLLGEYDVMCLTKHYGLFVCEVKSTFSTSKRWREDAAKAWQQALKDDAVFKALNADFNFAYPGLVL